MLGRVYLISGDALGLLLVAQFEVLAALEHLLPIVVAFGTRHLEHDLLSGLGFLVEDRLGLATKPGLLSIVATLSLRIQRIFALFVLGHLVKGVLVAVFVHAVRFAGFRYDNLRIMLKS